MPGSNACKLALLFLSALMIAMPPRVSYAMLQPDEALGNPTLEARAQALGDDLRCMVCQSESINDSPAGIAHDIRVLIREQIQAGQTDDEILAFLRARYGDQILLRPPLQADTLVLWFAPFVILAIGAGILIGHAKSRNKGRQ